MNKRRFEVLDDLENDIKKDIDQLANEFSESDKSDDIIKTKISKIEYKYKLAKRKRRKMSNLSRKVNRK
jgi:hypothetical protein